MNKADLISSISNTSGVSRKDVENVLDVLEETIKETIKGGDDVTLTGFGTFSARQRSARMGVNPQNPSEKIQIPAVIVPKFKAGKALKDYLK